MKRLRVFLLLPGWDAVLSQGYPPALKFAGTHLYIWVERGTVRVKCLAQEQNTLLYSWRFSRPTAPTHWLVSGHMTSNNETVSRQML